MNQIDWIGSTAKPRAFKDIRNQRPSVAEEKARLCLELGNLTQRVPASIMAAGIEKTRQWRAAQESAIKVLKSSRSSVTELTIAIKNMQAAA